MISSTILNILAASAIMTGVSSSPLKIKEVRADFVAPSAKDVYRAENPCPPKNAAGQSIVTTWDKSQYLCEDDISYIAGDITGIVAYSVQDCADACATFAKFNDGECNLFTHDADISRSYEINNGANCWLKNSKWTDGKNTDYNGSSAKLIKKA